MTTQMNTLAQINQNLIAQMTQLQAQQRNFESQLALLAQQPPPPTLNPSTQPPSRNPPPNPNHHTCKAIFLRSGTSYPAPVESLSDDLGEGSLIGNDLQVYDEHEDELGGGERE